MVIKNGLLLFGKTGHSTSNTYACKSSGNYISGREEDSNLKDIYSYKRNIFFKAISEDF